MTDKIIANAGRVNLPAFYCERLTYVPYFNLYHQTTQAAKIKLEVRTPQSESVLAACNCDSRDTSERELQTISCVRPASVSDRYIGASVSYNAPSRSTNRGKRSFDRVT